MDKNVSVYVMFLLIAVVIATVTSFGDDDMGDFNGNALDRKYQSWLFKRGLGQSSYGFGMPKADSRYYNWKDFLTGGISKRQLYYSPRSFGNFERYFTNGLQDWRKTFNGIKKRQADQKQADQA